MAIVGKLETMTLPDLLQWLSSNQTTGTLVVSDGHITKSIFFSDGRVISSASSNPAEHLGHFLVSHRFITEDQLAQAMRRQASSGALLGAILVEAGAISREDLDRMLVLKAEESLFELFAWERGDFRFIDDELPAYEMVPISLEVTALLLEGMQRQDEWAQIRQFVPSTHAVPVLIRSPIEGLEREEPRTRAVLELVNDDRSIEDLCLETHSSEYMVSKIVWQKACDGYLKVVRPRVISPPTPVTGADSADSLLTRARDLVCDGALDLAVRHYRAATSLEPDDHEVRQLAQQGYHEIHERLEVAGLCDDAVPRLMLSLDELADKGLTPEEGFMLSRVSGTSDLASIIKISPLSELDARLVLWRLQRAEIIELVPS